VHWVQSGGHSGMSSSKQPDIIIFANIFRPKYQFQCHVCDDICEEKK
jgi:hypothetical protein